jgi:hypothetical protein
MRKYLILIENLRTKKIYNSGFEACDHKEAVVLISKMTNYSWRRIFLKEI